ncbi:ExeA family protein [Azonexus sp. R2A61]|uniref:ExeA family protein n=1 Tax=Azonexus sp. R2A61 TaxID=2744443 RepID=UPI001F3B31FA|nr:AAA family ATPase [Azonexus sp. R2A61]
MMLRDLLQSARISQSALGAGARLSRGALHRLLAEGALPVRDADAPKRITDFLVERGVDRGALENLFTPQQKAPDVQQHAEASPEANPSHESEQEENMLLRYEALNPQAKTQFNLTRSPFVDDVRTRDDVFGCPNTRYVRAALLDAALNHGFVAIVGESGAGKSTLACELEERILAEGRQVVIVRPYVLAMEADDNKGRTLKSAAIAEACIRTLAPGETIKSSPDARFAQLENLLKSSRAAGYSHLIMIEEAHCMPKATLKHLKRFLELRQGLSRLLGICLIGQPELLNLLSDKSPEVREVVQRCETIELMPLDNDLESYIKHKFERVNAKVDDCLAPDAYDALRERLIRIPRGGKASDAISLCYPLAVNNLLTRAMNAAAGAGWPKVDAQVIRGC